MSAAATSLFVTLMFGLYGPIFLVLTWWTFRGVDGDVLRGHLRRTDERRTWVRWLLLSSPVSWASTVMIIGIVSVILLTTGEGRSGAWIIAICLVGVAGSWVLMVAVMAVEYMRRWAADGSLAFPGTQARALGDFVYVSVQMSTTFSSADVQLTDRGVRTIAGIHSVLAFAYSTAIIAVFASLLISPR
ncbi:DUF1345 domain-containing protein [Microbacterium flavum]|uniref:DUF1345 domain-containing protein n=1 Tax=Microbacterium flavum TaxID=415216 RepID=UPI0024ACCF04|nr:DUF1345 domain-containing protein [Microbacterium flavum]